ncbi:MAG: lipocalin family protein [Deltaproteobacteria bacterium]|nr:lipocalin family protein [Deltaproteobacteria bacterium]
MRIRLFLFGLLTLLFIQGCQTMPPIQTAENVDLERFMGSWYVVASIPTFFEKDVYNGIESYRLNVDGSVETTFSFNKGGFDGPLKTYRPRGFPRDKASNAVWDMQFVWPFKAEYRIVYLNDTYTQTVIGRTKRDYVWIMARDSSIPSDDYNRILQFLQSQGYDIAKIQKVPQKQNLE